MMCLAAMFAAGTGLKAQEITIVLEPGYNWISYPNAEAMPVVEALGSFTPANGDIIQSQFGGLSRYFNGNWRGGVTHFIPGWGYHYYSARSEYVELVFAHPASSSVATAMPTDITATNAVAGGMVMLPEGSHVFLRGVCLGTAPSPDIDGDHTTEETGIGSFSSTLEGLNPNTTYYVRAYVVSDHGLAYGNEQSFTTLSGIPNTAPTGAIDGKFTINSNGDQVYFSQGNLQYIGSAATPYWKFADNQWDVLGTTTGQNSGDQNVDRDLFGWGTSGYNHGANCYQPWSTSTSNSYYLVYGSDTYNLYDQTGQADWGYNPISNGGNQSNQWRTLTHSEWKYVFYTRTTTSRIRYAKAQVAGVNGVILLPDDWNTSTYSLSNTNTSGASFSSNTISASQWTTLQNAGAVFLPAAGGRYGTSVDSASVVGNGGYWSASRSGTRDAYHLYFFGTDLYTDYTYRSDGRSVRLVAPAEN